MPSSPASPSRPRRRSSGINAHLPRNTSQTSISGPSGRAQSRRSSNASLLSTTTPRPPSAHGSGILPDLGSSLHGENGLGSLADELAEEEWDEDVHEGDEHADLHHSAGSVPPSPELRNGAHPNVLSPPIIPEAKREYDGSDYGDDSDLEEVTGISKSLEARMADIEALARQSTGSLSGAAAHVTAANDNAVFARVNDQLRDLSSQTNVETGMARLATAHTALTSNLAHQSRTLTSLTQHLLSPLSAPPSSDVAADLSEQVQVLLQTLPLPLAHALTAAHALHDLSADLAGSLGQLGDTLQMTRQTTNGAARWLRSTVEAVATLRRELDEADAARIWLERHNAAERLRNREAASSCREVARGFEEVCDSWRARLEKRAAAQVEVGNG